MLQAHIFKFNKGDFVEDILTGYKGYVNYRVDYTTGCNQYGITARVDKDGKLVDTTQVDENRLKLVEGEPAIVLTKSPFDIEVDMDDDPSKVLAELEEEVAKLKEMMKEQPSPTKAAPIITEKDIAIPPGGPGEMYKQG